MTTEVRENAIVQSEFLTGILEKIKPEYFLINDKIPESPSTRTPTEAIDTNLSRIFDHLAHQITLPKDIYDEYLNNVFNYGFEYASAVAINPIIEAIVDIKEGKLKETFIKNNLSVDNYNKIKLLTRKKIRDDIRLKVSSNLNIQNLTKEIKATILKEFPNKTQAELEESINNKIKQIIESEVDKEFANQFPTDTDFQNHADFVIAHGFIDACSVLFNSVKIKDIDDNNSIYRFITGMRGKYDQHRNKECTGNLRLYNKHNKYYFCSELSDEINQLSIRFGELAGVDALNTSRINKDDSYDIFQARLMELQSSTPKIKGLGTNLLQYIDLLSKIDDFSESKDEDKLLFVNEANKILNKYNYDNVQYKKQRYNALMAAAISILVVVGVAAVTFATFGAGAALIPFIPGIISLAVSAALGITMTGFFVFKSQNFKQKLSANQIPLTSSDEETKPLTPSPSLLVDKSNYKPVPRTPSTESSTNTDNPRTDSESISSNEDAPSPRRMSI